MDLSSGGGGGGGDSGARRRGSGGGGGQGGESAFGEVGRVLLSSTILGSASGIQATMDHFARCDVLPVAGALRRQLMEETEAFALLAADNAPLLRTKLAQQRKHNAMLRARLRQRRPEARAAAEAAEAQERARARAARWRTPRSCGYDSDSTATSATASRADFDSDGGPPSPRTDKAALLRQARELMGMLLGESPAKDPLERRELLVLALDALQRSLAAEEPPLAAREA